jgi:hypothetical protein
MAGDRQGDVAEEEVLEAIGVARHEGLDDPLDLAPEDDRLADQIAAVPGQESELLVDRVGLSLGQAEAVDGGAVDGGQVGVVGLVAGIGRLAKSFGSERVDDPDLEPGGGERAPRREVIASGPLDGDNQVSQMTIGDGLPELCEGGVEVGPGVLDDGGRNECLTIEVGQHPFRAVLGTVDADDAEVLGPGGLDSGVQGAGWFLDLEMAATAALAVVPACECPRSHR